MLTGNILMIVGGAAYQPSRKSEDKAYTLSLDPSVEVPSCLATICDFPRYVECPSMATFDGLPTICGGRDINADPETYHTECYQFNITRNSWGDPEEPFSYTSRTAVHTGKNSQSKTYEITLSLIIG